MKRFSSWSDYNAAASKKTVQEKQNVGKNNNDGQRNCQNKQPDGRNSANGTSTSMLDARIKAIAHDKGSTSASASLENNVNVEEKRTAEPLSAKPTNYHHRSCLKQFRIVLTLILQKVYP